MSDAREAWCAATMFSGSLCTRPAGHEGHHFHRDPWAEGSPDIREALVARQREEYGESWDVLVPEVGWTLGRIIESVIEDALAAGWTPPGERVKLRAEVERLRARIERVEALTEGLLTAEGWNDPEVETVLLIQRRYRAALAGSGEQPGGCGHTEHAVRGDGRYGRHFETADPAGEWVRCPAPVTPDSADVREGEGDPPHLAHEWAALSTQERAEVFAWFTRPLAAVGQGVTAEQRDEAILAATREVAKQARPWPGDGLLHDVRPVEAADAAVRAALESLGVAVRRKGGGRP